MSASFPKLVPLAAWLALSSALGGCVIGPDYVRPDFSLPSVFRAPVAVPESTLINAQWWTLFGDARLNELVEQAAKNNVDVRQAIARMEQADALAREAGAAFLPEVDAQAAGSQTHASTRTATYAPGAARSRQARSAGLTTAYEVDVWGRVRRTNEAAQSSLLASRFARDAIRLSVTAQLVQQYLSLRALDAQLSINDETTKSRESSLSLVRQRVEAGLVSPIDQYQAESSLAAARAQQADLRRQRAQAENQLALLVGQPDLRLPAGDIRALPLPPNPPEGLPAQLVEARPDIRQAEQVLITANAGIGAAKAGYYPKFTLTGTAGSESKAMSDLFGAGASAWSLGLGLVMPLIDFGRTRARVDQATALTEQSRIAWESALRTAYKEVRDALVGAEENRAAEGAQDQRQTAALRTLELARLRYESGYVGYLEVLDAERSANEARQAFVSARAARLASSVDLFKALGGGWKPQP